MSTFPKRVLAILAAPLLRWISAQLADLRASVDSLLAQQSELVRTNHQVSESREAQLEVVSRSVAVQTATLESIEAEQRRLREEIERLRSELAASTAAGSSTGGSSTIGSSVTGDATDR